MDNYEEIKTIGKGSYGVVVLVKCKKDKKQYVLKKLNLGSVTPKDRITAEQEAKLLSKLKHPNIVAYKDSFETPDRHLCIVMGYCEAGDLYNRLKLQKGEPLPEMQVIEWFVQIAMALEYMHSENIMHRDLKTQNIFLTKSKIIKVGDLGIARVLDGSNDMARTLIGTPYYMSPEIFANKPYNFKSDVWALGCCIYEMLSLKHAFQGKDMNSLMYRIQRGKMPLMPDKYSDELVNLVKAMLNKNPEKRPRVSRILRDPFIKKSVALILEESQINSQPSSSKRRSKKESKKSSEKIEPLNVNSNDLATIAEEATPRPTVEMKRSSSSRRSSNTSIQEQQQQGSGKQSSHQIVARSIKDSDDEGKPKVRSSSYKSREIVTSLSSSSSSSNDLQKQHNDSGMHPIEVKPDKSARERRRQKQEQIMPNRSIANVCLNPQNEDNAVEEYIENRPITTSKSDSSISSGKASKKSAVNSSPSKSQPRQVTQSPSRSQSRQVMSSPSTKSQPRQVTSSPSKNKKVSSSLNNDVSDSQSKKSISRSMKNDDFEEVDRTKSSGDSAVLLADSDSEDSDELGELQPPIKNKSKRGQNKFFSLLGTLTLRQQRISPNSSDEEEECKVVVVEKKRVGRPPLQKKALKGGATFVKNKSPEIVEIPNCAESIPEDNDDKMQDQYSAEHNNELSITTGRLYDRMISLRKECMRRIGKDKLYVAFEILDGFDQDEIEPQLIKLLGRDDYDEFAGKIMQLKYCEESAIGLNLE